MLEYFSYKKVKKHRDEKAAAAKQKSEQQDKDDNKPAPPETTNDKTAAVGGSGAAPGSASPPAVQIISKPAGDDDGGDAISIEGTPILDHEDEKFLERLTSAGASVHDEDEGPPPPLPPRVKTPVIDIDSDTSSEAGDSKDAGGDDKGKGKGKGKGKDKDKDKEQRHSGDKPKRFSFVTNLSRNISLRRKPAGATTTTASPSGLHSDHLAVPAGAEATREHDDMARVLDDLDLAARDDRAFSLSAESADTVRRFTQVLRDLVRGVPTAYGDLTSLLDDRDGLIARGYERLPSGLKKLVAQLPEKLTSTLAPELLAVAAEAQGLSVEEAGAKEGLKGAAKKFLAPGNLHELVTKPGALVGLLKGIVNALKTRFPAFVGTNVLWSLAVFLLLSMLWYCYKRGREVRLEQEAADAAAAAAATADAEGKTDDTIEGRPRVEELPDDPMLTSAATATATTTATADTNVVRDGATARD
ncbi:putative ring-like domain-containing protein [Rosellinia necatrix]|uniref:Putative ring-like domain-containing protein n=1 Tax=Rosellinia necatrix TaxID=77044 RepID=A0A1S7UHU5_ROSNE|nr:putative ring-like domain-containing protein [Rosellinia necatrix]